MTQEDKELLLKDLSARLPYGVIIRHADYLIDSDGNYTGQFWYKRGYLYNICRLDNMTTTIIESDGSDEKGYEHICDLERSLPYLRPMSSMTEEEKDEMFGICTLSDCSVNTDWESVGVEIMSSHPRYGDHYSTDYSVIDWLNKNMFDYRGLIEKGLAIEVTEDNNPYKE
jgi:hypothetical protein